MLLAGCSTVCTTVAEAAKMWNLIVVSNTNKNSCRKLQSKNLNKTKTKNKSATAARQYLHLIFI